MRARLLAGALLVTASFAMAQPQPAIPPPIGGGPVRKPVTDKYTPDVISKFVDGIIADKAGEYGDALRAYEEANRIAPQPNTFYNMADIARRLDRTKDAIASYRKYLELAPDAPDKAAVEKLVEQLAHAPVLVTIDGEEPDAIILVDGKLVGPSPVTMRLPEGKHVADRVTAEHSEHAHFEVRAGQPEHVHPSNWHKDAGNVLLSSGPGWTTSGSWRDRDGGREWQLPGRQSLPPGKYSTRMWNDDRACSPLTFEVQPGDHITYVYIDAGPRTGDCQPLTITTQKLKVPK